MGDCMCQVWGNAETSPIRNGLGPILTLALLLIGRVNALVSYRPSTFEETILAPCV